MTAVCGRCVLRTLRWAPYLLRSLCAGVRGRLKGEPIFPCLRCDASEIGVACCDNCAQGKDKLAQCANCRRDIYADDLTAGVSYNSAAETAANGSPVHSPEHLPQQASNLPTQKTKPARVPVELCRKCVAGVRWPVPGHLRGQIGEVPFPCRRCDGIAKGVWGCDRCYTPLEFMFTRHFCCSCKEEIKI